MRNYFFIVITIVFVASCTSGDNNEAVQPNLPVCISDTSRSAMCVYLTSDEKNNPVVSWCETDNAGKKSFYLSFFDIVERKFSSAVDIPIEQNVSLHEEGMPKVAFKSDGGIVAVYETSLPAKQNQWAGQVRYMQSFDRGKTWTQPANVHSDTASANSHSFAAITRLSDGEIGACWLDQTYNYKKGGRPVKFASTDKQKGFANEVLVDSLACECCRLAIAANAHNKVSIVYRDIINDSIRDISISTSSNNGRAFSAPTSFSQDHWNINGCPHNGPGLVSTQSATYAVWFTGGSLNGVYYGELNNKNVMVEKKHLAPDGRNIQLCILSDEARIAAYSENVRAADSVYSRIVMDKIQSGKIFTADITAKAAHAAYPVVTAYSKSGIVIAWTENHRVYYKQLESQDISKEVFDPVPAASKPGTVTVTRLSMHTDPVCGMRIADDAENTISFAGKVVGFCSQSCKEKFLTDPPKYQQKLMDEKR